MCVYHDKTLTAVFVLVSLGQVTWMFHRVGGSKFVYLGMYFLGVNSNPPLSGVCISELYTGISM